MKANRLIAQTILVIFINYKFTIAHSKKYISIEEAINNKLIQASITSTGDHQEYCINANVKSLVKDTCFILIEAGRRLDSQKDFEQDILVTKQSRFKVPPFKEVKEKVYGFCCQLGNSCPQMNSKYRVGKMADSILIKLATFINNHQVTPSAQQNSVWAFSNNRSIETIPQSFNQASDSLIQFCAALKKVQPPNYYYDYKKVTGLMVSDIKDFFNTKFNYKKKAAGRLQIVVFDKKGNIIKTLVDNNFAGSSDLSFSFKIPLFNWKRGDYFLRVIENNETSYEKKIEV
jgi:hypothetical protein